MSSGQQINNSGSANSQQNHRYHIRKNNLGQNQLHLPVYYQQQSQSSSFQYLKQENRILKKRIKHLQQHTQDALNQYNSLHEIYQASLQRQKTQIAKNHQLNSKLKKMYTKIQEKKKECQQLIIDNQHLKNKFEELQKNLRRNKQNENKLTDKIVQLQQEIQQLKIKATQRDLKKSKVGGQNQNDRIINEMKITIEEYQLQISKKDGIIRQLTKQSNKSKNQLKQMKDQLQDINQNNLNLKKKFEKLQKIHKQNQKQKNNFKNQKEQLQQQVNQLRKELTKIKRKEKENIQNDQFSVQKRNQIDQEKFKKIIKKLESQNNNLQEEIYKLKKQAKNKKLIQDQQSKPIKIIHQENRQDTQRAQKIQVQNRSLKKKVQSLQNQIKDMQKQVFELKNSGQKNINTFNQKLHKNQNLEYSQMIQLMRIELLQKQKLISELQKQILLRTDEINGLKIQLTYLQTELRITKPNINISFQASKYRRTCDQDDLRTSQMLQQEYNNQLQALRRLILYKKYSNEQAFFENNQLRVSRIRRDYQQKIAQLLNDYKLLQSQLEKLRIELLHKDNQINRQNQINKNIQVIQAQRQAVVHQQIRLLLIKLERFEQERLIYIQSINKWQIAYEDLKKLYEQKLISKEHHINLLKLKLGDYKI